MLTRSPFFAMTMELLAEAVRAISSGKYSIAVIHLAHACEVIQKGVLVERNISIYIPETNKTLSFHKSRQLLVEILGVASLPNAAVIEMLWDERNSIQHRFGGTEKLTVYYYLEAVLVYIDYLVSCEAGQSIRGIDGPLAQEIDDEHLVLAIPYLADDIERDVASTKSQAEGDPVAVLLKLSEALFRTVITTAKKKGIPDRLDIVDVYHKFANLLPDKSVSSSQITQMVQTFRMRNHVIHGDHKVKAEEVMPLVEPILQLVDLAVMHEDVLLEAIRLSVSGEDEKNECCKA